jgi:hypothetical protein
MREGGGSNMSSMNTRTPKARRVTQSAAASTSASPDATSDVLVSPVSKKRAHPESNASSPVETIRVHRQPSGGATKHASPTPGAHSHEACPGAISDFNCYGMPRKEHPRKETGKEPRYRR